MAGRILVPGWTRALNSDGDPVSASVSLFNVGTDELATLYSNEALTVPLANPVESNSAGRFPAIWAADDVELDWSVEAPYGPPGSPYTGIGLTVALAAEVLAAEAAEAAADEAAESAASAAADLAAIQAIEAEGSELPAIVGKLDRDGSNVTSPSTFRANTGSDQAANVNYAVSGTATRSVQAKLLEMVSVKDPPFNAVGNGTTDDSAAFTAALAAARNVIVPAGTYNLASMVEVAALGIGGRTLLIKAGATLTRTTGASTDPLLWIKNDDCAVIGEGKASIVTTTRRHPEGLVLIGHRNLASAHANVRNCTLANVKLSGMLDHGQTTGSPDILLRLCSTHIGAIISYFHTVKSVMFEKSNIGLQFLGDANGNYSADLFFQYIGNPTLSADRVAIDFDGGLENIVEGFFFHSSPGSTAVRMRDRDNTGNGGIVTQPQLNHIMGSCEQDPSPAGGLGLVANAGCTGVNNRIDLIDNCPANDVGLTFRASNFVKLVSSQYDSTQYQSRGFVAINTVTLPTDRTAVGLGVDQTVQEAYLRCIYEGADWRVMNYLSRRHAFSSENSPVFSIGTRAQGGIASTTTIIPDAADDAAAAALSPAVAVGQFYRTGSILKIRVA